MNSDQSITTAFPLGLFCTATFSGPLPEITPRSMRPTLKEKTVAAEPLTDAEIDELTADLCPAGRLN